MKRRDLILYGAVAAFSAGPLMAHRREPFDFPTDYLPTHVETDRLVPSGEIHVFPDQFRLYWTLPNQQALRFTVGVGRPGLYHAGEFTVGRKAKWPRWRPTDAMIRRDPKSYRKYSGGMPGGPSNPLGARALYLYDENGRDTYLRIHGTNQPRTIGTRVSNGCARMTNDQIENLYASVPVGTRVLLYEQNL